MTIAILCIILILVVGVSIANRRVWQQTLAAQLQDNLANVQLVNKLNETVDKLVVQANQYVQEASVRNTLLDFVLTHYRLNLPDPYVQRPTFEEKRCMHCMYPDYAGHDSTCPWVTLRPYTSVLYPPPPSPVVNERETVSTEAQTLLPVEPEHDIEVPEAVQDALK